MNEYMLEMIGITKIFPGVKALDNVELKVKQGEIHAICGENGAGKSTLIKVLSGVYPAGTYTGDILLNGEKKVFGGIKDAEGSGIVCIHQELALVPELDIAENIFLGNQPNSFGFIKWSEVYYNTASLLEEVGLVSNDNNAKEAKISPDTKIMNLGIGQQQLVEIAKALSKNAKLLILDEPTAALTEHEVDILLGILKKLKQKGVTCIYISHKLDEVMRIADSVTVFRDGCSVASSSVADIEKRDIIKQMVGRELTNLFPKERFEKGEKVLEVKNFNVYNPLIPSKKLVKDINFEAYKGEVLGISGLMGSGRTELFTGIFGAFDGKTEGDVYIDGVKVNIKSPFDAIKNGVSLVTEDRKKYGLVLEMDIKENTTLSSLRAISKGSILNESEEILQTNEYVKYLKTKAPSIETKVKNLSGGNQQKVVLGKALMTKPKILVLDEPTRGIDVGAKYEIYKIMNKLVAQGVVIIMISSELEEIIGMSDRVIVMGEGEIRGQLLAHEVAQEDIMQLATGGDL